jgi:3-hydroxy-9,10-secoandrosta-1,3,5(10)-triene-9,17-dione monooxygenase
MVNRAQWINESPARKFRGQKPDFKPEQAIDRARQLKDAILAEASHTENKERHEQFLKAGFYRNLQFHRFGGYEFDVPTS